MTPRQGLKAAHIHRVGASELATSWGGSVPVFASPALIGRIETTCMRVADHLLTPDLITLGVEFDIKHLAPTPPDNQVEIVAELIEVRDGALVYVVAARDAAGTIASGRHLRRVVDRQRFMRKVGERASVLKCATLCSTTADDRC